MSLFSESTTGSFSILCACKICDASARLVFLVVVIRFSPVMTSAMALSIFCWNLRSRLVTIPIRKLFASTTGMPPILYSFIRLRASLTVPSLRMVMGSWIITLSALFTRLTWRACSSRGMFLWITPIPPSLAMVMASCSSVTVSMAADRMGMFREMFLENCDLILTCLGRTSE